MSSKGLLDDYLKLDKEGSAVLSSILDILNRRLRLVSSLTNTPIGCFENYGADFEMWSIQKCELLLKQLRGIVSDMNSLRNKFRERKVLLEVEALFNQDYFRKVQLLESSGCAGQLGPDEAAKFFQAVANSWSINERLLLEPASD
jgi:hypothetical protein